jgi:hypothetical protein
MHSSSNLQVINQSLCWLLLSHFTPKSHSEASLSLVYIYIYIYISYLSYDCPDWLSCALVSRVILENPFTSHYSFYHFIVRLHDICKASQLKKNPSLALLLLLAEGTNIACEWVSNTWSYEKQCTLYEGCFFYSRYFHLAYMVYWLVKSVLLFASIIHIYIAGLC